MPVDELACSSDEIIKVKKSMQQTREDHCKRLFMVTDPDFPEVWGVLEDIENTDEQVNEVIGYLNLKDEETRSNYEMSIRNVRHILNYVVDRLAEADELRQQKALLEKRLKLLEMAVV